jgi:hypothetical protein
MGCVRRGKKQKQGPRTLTKEEATGRERERFDHRGNTERIVDQAMYSGKLGAMLATVRALSMTGRW